MLIVVTFGLAFASIVDGVIAISRSAKSNSEDSTGVGLVGIGLVLAYLTILWWEF
jgi:hypothetical protein